MGTVTFLFTDIEGSTRLLTHHRTDYAAVLERHRALLREASVAESGVEVDTEGDAVFFVFPSATSALRAAVEAQLALAGERWPEQLEVKVRMGLLSGEAELHDGTYVGLDVHRAARIAASAHGGQVVISPETTALVGGGLPPGVTLRDLGEHLLKDFDQPTRLAQLVIDGLPSVFPPLRTPRAGLGTLPSTTGDLIGRDAEIEAIGALVHQSRLVTLTGPGGVGKTSLAIGVARRTESDYSAGVWFVPLASLREANLVMPAIAAAIGLTDRGGANPASAVAQRIGADNALLVLDNFEQVEAAADDVADLLEHSTQLHLLVTSRVLLRLYPERIFVVPPLETPPSGSDMSAENLLANPSVALFVDRARAISGRFVLTDDSAPAIAELARQLDGLPLAIELAAARADVLPPARILAGLTNRLTLRNATRNAPERQRTLSAAIEWSYELLSQTDRELFAGLAAFSGGADLEAIEAVLGQDNPVWLEGLQALVEGSLISVRDKGNESRYVMLETILAFASERLNESDEQATVLSRHREYFTDLAIRAQGQLIGRNAAAWLDRLENDHDNLRAVLNRATQAGDANQTLRLSAALWRFWQRRGYLTEGLARVEAALAAAGGVEPAVRADALEAAGGLAYWMANAEVSRKHYEEALELRRRIGEKPQIAEALYNLSFSLTMDQVAAGSSADQAADRTHALGLLQEALEIFERLGDRTGVARTSFGLAASETFIGKLGDAQGHARQGLLVAREVNDEYLIAWLLYLDGHSAIGLGDLDHARGPLVEALRMLSATEDVGGYTLVLDALAALAARVGDRERAARLSGAVAELERRTSTRLVMINRSVIDWDPSALRTDPGLEHAWDDGAAMALANVVAYALSEVS